MTMDQLLKDKKILLVDDEQDILDTLEELLPMCETTTASTFEQAKNALISGNFDFAILDIMGVDGFKLLDIANEQNIPVVMITAHALSVETTINSFNMGAAFFVPKDKMQNIETYLVDILETKKKKMSLIQRWLDRFDDYYKNNFGKTWKKSPSAIDFWDKFPKL